MPTTRSASKKQKSLEDYSLGDNRESGATGSSTSQSDQPKSRNARSSNPASKRKSAATEPGHTPKKPKHNSSSPSTLKQTQGPHATTDTADTSDPEKPILINRSPVLQLWAAIVADFLHPDEAWATCLSIGGSISALCAISKGRAIGKIEPKDSTAKAKDKNKKQTYDDIRELKVMGFTLKIKDGVVVVDDKPKSVKEHLLQAKFGGEEEYMHVKQTMEEALRPWSDDKEKLDKKAFHMYEQFRPSTAAASSGWGRKGQVHMDRVKSAIESKN